MGVVCEVLTVDKIHLFSSEYLMFPLEYFLKFESEHGVIEFVETTNGLTSLVR